MDEVYIGISANALSFGKHLKNIRKRTMKTTRNFRNNVTLFNEIQSEAMFSFFNEKKKLR